MKRILYILIIMLLVTVMAVPTFAVTRQGDELSNSLVKGDVELAAEGAIYYKFTKTSQTNNNKSAPILKVSADITGKGEFHTSYIKSTSRTLNVSLTSSQESRVKSTITGGYGMTLSSEVGVTVYKEKSAKGYLAFQPYRRVIKGKLKTYNTVYANINGGLVKTQSITAKYPQKLKSGIADGNYYVKYY